MRKTKKKILIIILLTIMLSNMCMNTLYAAVAVDVSQFYLEKIGQADYHLKYYREDRDKYSYLICSIVGYYDADRNFNPTYCMNKNLSGAEDSPYNVTVDSLLNNDGVWRVIKNGYPYKNAQELGLSSEFNAYAVTKWAIYCILGESRLDYYKAEDDDLEAIAMLNILKKLVDIGLYGTEKQEENPMQITKINDFIEEDGYYSQEYKVTSTVDFKSYKVNSINGLPEGAFISNLKGEKQNVFDKQEGFKIKFNKNKLQQDINVELEISAECKSYVILEGKTTIENRQNYVITAGEFAKIKQNITLDKKMNTGEIILNKYDLDTGEKMQGVGFELKDSTGKSVSKAVTDENGCIIFSNLYQGKYILKETKTQYGYFQNEKEIEVEVKYNQKTTINMENESKKGQIKIIKVDAEDNQIKLKDIKFNVMDENGKVLEQIITDENGVAITSQYAIKDYSKLFLQEIETQDNYILDDKVIPVEVQSNEIKEIKIENQRKKGQIKIIKLSENEIVEDGKNTQGKPIENVKFDVYDCNEKLVDQIETSKDGIAITKLLDIGEYYVKEVDAGKGYLLNDKIFKTVIKENNDIMEIIIKNKPKEPSVKIEKTGEEIAEPKQEICYNFTIKNTGNVPLNNFVWYDYLPTDYVRITKINTGTYNRDLNYNIYYKTNKNEYTLLKEKMNTKVNNFIDFSKCILEDDEFVTEFKFDFGTVDVGFENIEQPNVYVKLNSNIENNDKFTNKTKIEGVNDDNVVYDEDFCSTSVYKEKIEVIKLPKTGM